MSDKTRKAITARIKRTADLQSPKPASKKAEPKESGGTQGQS